MKIRSAIPAALPLAIGMVLCFSPLQADPFSVALTDDPTALAAALLGPGTTLVGSPTLTSQSGQSGLFSNFASGPFTQTGGASGMFSLASGIILTTGIASGAEGNYVGGPSFDAFGAGDLTLTALSGGPTYDADVLQLSFTSSNPFLALSFVFASAEYPSSVGGPFADPLAIWINGVNVALVPGTATPINVNSVNAATNAAYFTQYSTPSTLFNYGGSTILLTANAAVSTSAVNTLRIGIADSGDGSVDSAILIQGGQPVPEPSTLLLFVGGGLAFVLARLRKRDTATRVAMFN